MNIPFMKLTPEAKMPEKGTTGAAGCDVVATSMTYSALAGTVTYGIGLAVELPKNTYLDVRSRSGLLKKEWLLGNGAGVIDSDYRGEIKLTFRPTNPDIDVRAEQPYKVGERIGQLLLLKHQVQTYVEVEELQGTLRGEGGHGSTGT